MPIESNSPGCPSLLAVTLLTSLVIAGCGDTNPEADPGNAPPATATTEDAADTASKAPVDEPFEADLSVASWNEIQANIAKRTGKIVVVDLWSTTCEPCLRELPGLVKLQKAFPDQVVCMSVNLDYTGAAAETPESHHEKVTRVLERRQMTFPNFISSTSDFDVYDTIQLASIPAVIIYDLLDTQSAPQPENLEATKRFDNDLNQYGDDGFSYEAHITPFVASLLGESEK